MTKASPEIEQLAAERLAADEDRSPARPGVAQSLSLGAAWRSSGGTRARG